jgi:hypothetical protein
MKKLMLVSLLTGLFLGACKKETIAVDNTPIVTNTTDKTIYSGIFENNAHSVSGNVKVIEDATKKQFLVIEDLKSDAGPDIRVYLATDKTAKDFVEISAKVVNGNSKIEMPASANLAKQKYVLIWCKQFSVLFGNALLK